MRRPIFLDVNAGAPIHPKVMAALQQFLGLASDPSAPKYLGNPSSQHSAGREASALIARAEESVLKSVRADPSEWRVVFTSSGTEANQLAIRGVLERRAAENPKRAPVWVVSPLEHACVLDLIEPMQARGVEVRMLKANHQGQLEALPSTLEGADLVSLMGVNNETGVVCDFTPITSHIQSASSSHECRVHSDFVAGWGKVDIDLSKSGGPDLIAIAGHKLGAPAGIGALVFRRSIRLTPIFYGSQQGELRGGTENLLGIIALMALTMDWEEIRREVDGLRELRDEFERLAAAQLPRIQITGAQSVRAPHISHFIFKGLPRDISLVTQLDLRGYAVAAGSACASSVAEPSHVLTAMGMPRVEALNSLRVSLPLGTRKEDLTGLVAVLGDILKRYESS